MVNIKVAVRIRPLSHRESLLGENVVVRKENKTVLVTNPKIPERQDGDSRQRTRRFAVDFCFDPTDSERCSQEAVYKEIGAEVLNSMFEGYNACVLAYGHSASGKTYTIMGIQDDPGLTPRLCRGLFEELEERHLNEKIRVQVTVSFLEIYNEKVRDLLGTEETEPTGCNFSLRVREHPKLGPYVQGLSEHLVADKNKLLELLTTGNRRRSTAATENNEHSSRSHAVFTIQFKQCDGENLETEKSSKVHLVDLAGSFEEVSLPKIQTDERANSSQSKERLKEGANINKSLVTLGNVVSALAESCESGTLLRAQTTSKSWHPFVPYRDSVLTWLLKDTLGGNSNTIMIATISPAGSCLSETLNTLRYAKRTKRIVNQPIVNEDPKISTIRQLRQEIVRLKRLLMSYQSWGSWSETEETNFKEPLGFSIPESKWPDTGGAKITNKEGNRDEKGSSKLFTEEKNQDEGEVKEDEPESSNEINHLKNDEERKKFEDRRLSLANDCEEGVLGNRTVFSEGNACKISDEKKSVVNGSVNDHFSHETQIFSDSLESFSSVFSKSGNSCEVAHDGSGRVWTVKNVSEIRSASTEKFSLCLMQDSGYYENLFQKKASGMLRRSRPDLIKGISSRFKEGPPSGSSQSCTDVSNLSQSTSENSLNSSGSADVLPLKKTPSQGRGKDDEALQSALRRTEKRSEIVEAVTSRLYVAKKEADRRGGVGKKETEEVVNLEELKLCKRARMKLFDLSRKLAMTRKIKKTVDNDTQTDNMTATLRVKEKCVTTEPNGASGIEEPGTPEESAKDEKPCVIMNQVFIPRESNCVVECGKVVRIETPEAVGKHESATQTVSEDRTCKNANTSPIKFNCLDEDSFSEDSLDLEEKSRLSEDQEKVDPEQKLSFDWPPGSEVYFSCESEKRYREKSKAESEKFKKGLFDRWPLVFLSEETTFNPVSAGDFSYSPCENTSEEWRKNENLSSENSFTSFNETEMSFSSETSSEDFVFYDSSKDKESSPKAKPKGDRELYTITENSEQSDTSDAFSPLQSQVSSLRVPQKKRMENTKDWREEGRFRKETMVDRPIAEGTVGRNGFIESKFVCADYKIGRENSGGGSEKIFTNFLQTSCCNKSNSESMEPPKPTSLINVETRFKKPDRVSRFGEGKACKADVKHSHPKGFRSQLRGTDTNSKPKTWTDFQSNSQKQYLNLSIPNAANSAFSVDTHLFGKASKDSVDAIFNSADSLTFVFMGPAKPKTSVLMEIIRRSLGKTFSPSDESSCAQKKSKSRGVQCDANLMRSASVDSAMIALSRIAKNQEPCSHLRRTASLGALNPGEVLNFTKNNSHCYFTDENSERENKSALKCTVATSTGDVKKIKKKEEAEKVKKSVSWFKETQHEVETVRKAPDFELNHRHPSELKAEHSNGKNFTRWPPERRVRFLKRREIPNSEETGTISGQENKLVGEADPMKAFLKEATTLLKHINSCSTKNPELSGETIEECDVERTLMTEKDHCIVGLSGVKTPERETVRSKRENCKSLEKKAIWESRGPLCELKSGNLTWPRMRSIEGKPPSGMKPRIPTSIFSFPCDCQHPKGFSESSRNLPRNNWSEPGMQPWKLSDLPMIAGDDRSTPLRSFASKSSRSSCCDEYLNCGWVGDRYSSPASPRPNVPKLNFHSVSELEMKVEESCRRLEMAAESDRIRESISSDQETDSEWLRKEERLWYRAGVENDKFQWGGTEPKIIKRRKPEKCAGSCTCSASRIDPCKYLWSKNCSSSFELDSFGPGSTHCHQYCMFCRKKDEEIYYSVLNLNSNCSANYCRLNYYGFCPCSSVRLSHVASSPRAYMQRLLALRRRIVNQTKSSNPLANWKAQN